MVLVNPWDILETYLRMNMVLLLSQSDSLTLSLVLIPPSSQEGPVELARRFQDEVLVSVWMDALVLRRLVAAAQLGPKSCQDDAAAGEGLVDEQALEAEDLSEGTGIIRGRNGRPPTKVATMIRKLEVLAEISYVPLEGRVDARAARQSVRALQPREVIVLGGTNIEGREDVKAIDEVTLLAEAIRSHSAAAKTASTPSDGETAELHVGHAAYPVRLIDTPYRPKDQMEENDEPPTPEELYEARLGECTVSRLEFVATGRKVALDGAIVLAPQGDTSATKQNQTLYLSDGDVLLTDLRAEMIAQGMKADYR
mmetsp:Transcript_18673/g.31914  ORF Transcript_18673/g.31914 Transcript_18673/m.31914 type:complete len:311 (+) Transcript_18673:95-1027(+)